MARAKSSFDHSTHISIERHEQVALAIPESHGRTHPATGPAAWKGSQLNSHLWVNIHGPMGKACAFDPGKKGGGEGQAWRVGETDDPVTRTRPQAGPKHPRMSKSISDQPSKPAFFSLTVAVLFSNEERFPTRVRKGLCQITQQSGCGCLIRRNKLVQQQQAHESKGLS